MLWRSVVPRTILSSTTTRLSPGAHGPVGDVVDYGATRSSRASSRVMKVRSWVMMATAPRRTLAKVWSVTPKVGIRAQLRIRCSPEEGVQVFLEAIQPGPILRLGMKEIPCVQVVVRHPGTAGTSDRAQAWRLRYIPDRCPG